MRALYIRRLWLSVILLGLLWGVSAAVAADDAPARQPVPPADAQARAKQLVEELYAADLRDKSAARKVELAQRLLEDSEGEGLSAVQRYMLLQTAGTLFAEAGDAAGAVSAVELLAEAFEIDERAACLEWLTRANSGPSTPDRAQALAEQCLRQIDDALQHDDVDAAEKFADLAESAATRSRQTELRTRVRNLAKQVQQYKVEFAAAQTAQHKLVSDPADRDASLAVGKFRCFWQDDWKTGLPLLAAGSDPVLKLLAETDLAGPTPMQDEMAIGHAWWNRGDKESGPVQAALRRRATHWYIIALPGLTGLTRSLAEKRLAEMEAAAATVLTPRATSPQEKPVKGQFIGKVKGSGSVWVNGKMVLDLKTDNRVQTSAPLYLREGDVVVVQVESRFVYRAARLIFLAEDDRIYLPVRCQELRDVTNLSGATPESVTADQIASATSAARSGRPTANDKELWENAAPGTTASEWFFGSGRGTYLFGFVVDPAKYESLSKSR